MNRTVTFMAGLVVAFLIGFLLIVARGLLIPLIVAIFIWYFINTLNNSMQRIPWLGSRLPMVVSLALSLLVIGIMFKLLATIITDNVADVIEASPRYQENLFKIMNKMDDYFNIKILTNLDDFLKSLSIKQIILSISGVFTTVMSSAVLIALYVVFLFVEQLYFTQKMNALFTKSENRKLANNILSHIARDTQTYLGFKTLTSIMTALASWIIMKAMHLDFAEFWALLIFFLNFIPSIGAIIATAFPALLALVQFDSWIPFIIITSGLSLVQFIVGSIIEPKFLGRSLNLSTLVIVFSLALWGSIWGVLGMVLAVPITVMMMIVFAHFESTRSIAILLSQDGQIKRAYETL